jgi:hypothetical protein
MHANTAVYIVAHCGSTLLTRSVTAVTVCARAAVRQEAAERSWRWHSNASKYILQYVQIKRKLCLCTSTVAL